MGSERLPARVALVVDVRCEGMLPTLEVNLSTIRASEIHDPTLQVRHRRLRHESPHLLRVQFDSVDSHLCVSLVDVGQLLANGLESVQVNAGHFGLGSRPQDGGVRSPDLDTTRVVALLDRDRIGCLALLGGCRSKHLAQGSYGVAHARTSIGELPAAAMALVLSVRMDGEPVAFQMRKAAVDALDWDRLEAEDTRDHVINRVDLVDVHPTVGEKIRAERNPQSPVGPVNVLSATLLRSCVDVDASIGGLGRGVVDGRHRPPQGDPAGVVREVEVQRLVRRDRRVLSSDTLLRCHSVFGRGVRVMFQAPVAGPAIPRLPNCDNLAIHR